MAIPYSKKMLVQRVRKYLSNSKLLGDDFVPSDNEILLSIDSNIPFVLKGMLFENAKVTGVFDVPEAYLVTYNITPLTKVNSTGEWVGTLPQTPLALPSGYNINDMYFSDNLKFRGQGVFLIDAKRTSYRDLMPKPSGVSARLEGNLIYLSANNGMPLNDSDFYVQMPVSRTEDVDAPMNLPDDAINPLFSAVVKSLLQRYSVPMDIVEDDLPAGNKSS